MKTSEADKIIIERIYNAPIAVVWKAITDREQLRKWYFDFAEDFAPEEGCSFEWKAGPPGGKQWLHRGKILDVIEGKKLVHSWEYPGYAGYSIVTWELIEVNSSSTKLLFTHHFEIPFDPTEDALQRKNFNEGWNAVLNTSLAEFLEKKN